MSKYLKHIWGIVTNILLVVVVIAAVLFIGVRLVGLEPYVVLSGSMEPAYHVGSLIYVKKVDPLTLKEGDPVTFMVNKNTVATHRIIEVIPDRNDPSVVRFRTKGDNNDIPDGDPIHCKNVIGKPVFTIPYLGYAVNYIQVPPGRYVAFAVCILLIVSVLFGGEGKKAEGAHEEQKKEEDESDTLPPPPVNQEDMPKGLSYTDPNKK